jgi:hypothetical protein
MSSTATAGDHGLRVKILQAVLQQRDCVQPVVLLQLDVGEWMHPQRAARRRDPGSALPDAITRVRDELASAGWLVPS